VGEAPAPPPPEPLPPVPLLPVPPGGAGVTRTSKVVEAVFPAASVAVTVAR
jgi:hypothetical protein